MGKTKTNILIAGAAIGGGFFTERFFIGDKSFGLITAGKALGEHAGIAWHPKRKSVPGAIGIEDGMANTIAMAEAGSPLAKWALGLNIDGCTDWFIPTSTQTLVQFWKLHLAKVGPFAPGGSEEFENDLYWTSTQHAAGSYNAWYQYFGLGNQGFNSKYFKFRARAVRVIPL